MKEVDSPRKLSTDLRSPEWKTIIPMVYTPTRYLSRRIVLKMVTLIIDMGESESFQKQNYLIL